MTVQETVGDAAKRVDAVAGEWGLTGLVNNAGIAVAGPLETMPLSRFRDQMDVNVTGQLAATQAFLTV